MAASVQTAAATTTLLGLGAAVIWGAADFCGGIAARHLRVFWLLAISHTFSFICLVLLAAGLRQPVPNAHILTLGLIAGFAGGTALLTFYSALSLGEMGITAATTGLLTAALPVVFALLTIGAPSRRQMAGFALAAVAIWLISTQAGGTATRAAVSVDEARVKRKRWMLGIISGVGFGTFLIFLQRANGGGLLWPLAASRIGSLTLAVGGGLLFSRGKFLADASADEAGARRRIFWKVGIGLTLLASVCDTGGNFLFVAATKTGRLDIAAVLASLYPASTIVLAIWLLKERTSVRQAVGMVAALVAVVLIS